jgi:Flp pilus assembly secretin CpaC
MRLDFEGRRIKMTSFLRACLFAAALPLITISATWAADQPMTLRLGTSSALALERPFKTILIGDPSIVDVRSQNDRAVILEPLGLGATNLIFVDEQSIAIANVGVLVCSAGAVRIAYRDEPGCE